MCIFERLRVRPNSDMDILAPLIWISSVKRHVVKGETGQTDIVAIISINNDHEAFFRIQFFVQHLSILQELVVTIRSGRAFGAWIAVLGVMSRVYNSAWDEVIRMIPVVNFRTVIFFCLFDACVNPSPGCYG